MNIAQNPNSELSHFAVNTPQVFEIPETCVGFQKLLRKRGLFLQWKQYGQKTQRLLICFQN